MTQSTQIRTPRHPGFWQADPIDPDDRGAWKTFGTTGCGREFLYLLSNQDGLVYVGITWNPFARWTYHARTKQWWPLVNYATVWHCWSEYDARVWETHCIKTMRPAMNIHQAVC